MGKSKVEQGARGAIADWKSASKSKSEMDHTRPTKGEPPPAG
jgi:hypothetical protein